MKWQIVPVYKPLIAGIMAVLLLIGGGTLFLVKSSGSVKPVQIDSVTQLGFYDLMSQRKEIYDSSMKTVNNTILMTITSPDDNRFVLKGKFSPVDIQDERFFFSYLPIYFSSTRKGMMIDGLVDLLLHEDIWLERLSLNGQALAVGQSGMIFLCRINS